MIESRYKKIIDLGFHPYADTFITKKSLHKSEPIYNLSCYLHAKSGIIKNHIKTKAEERYNLYDYSYTSSNSKFSRAYWNSYCKDIVKDLRITGSNKILEIGSNDGYLLNCFKKNKINNVVGIDASKSITRIANKKGIKTLNLIFNFKTSKIVKKKIGKFDLIIANNVVNHSDDIDSFLKGIKNILKKNGTFVFEVPYWKNLVLNKKFDQIYHEHNYYFTVMSAYNILKNTGLQLFKSQETYYHGGSIRIFAKINKKPKILPSIKKIIINEKKIGLFKVKTYLKITKIIQNQKFNLIDKIIKFKNKGYTIVGIGAAAKANTLLNFIKADNNLIDFITDNSKFKINKFTPMSRIPIIHDRSLKKFKKICAIILSWNLEKMIKKKLIKINKNIKYLKFN